MSQRMTPTPQKKKSMFMALFRSTVFVDIII